MNELSELLDKAGLVLATTLVGFRLEGTDGKHWKHYHWTVTVTGRDGYNHTTDYRSGVASAKPMPRSWEGNQFEWYLDKRSAVPPTLAEVVAAWLVDAHDVNETFVEWCEISGRNTDSRKALADYLVCQDTERALRRLLGEHYAKASELAGEL